MSNQSLEDALEAIEREAAVVVRASAAVHTEAKRVRAAAASGQLRALRQSLETLTRLAEQTAVTAREVQSGWAFDEHAYFASGGYTAEVMALAAGQGLSVFASDERMLSYPAVVSLSASDASVLIDKVKDRRVRPSVLVRTLKALQARPPKFKAEVFLEALATAYRLVVASSGVRAGATVKLLDVYHVLTVLPGSAKEYSRQELARDLYLLDQSGVTTTRDGRVLALPASALTRDAGVLRTVTRSGQDKVYAGISFEGGRS